MKIYLLLIVIGTILPLVFYSKKWLRFICVLFLLTLGTISCFGIQTSSRLTIANYREKHNAYPSQEWQQGATETRLQTQKWTPVAFSIFLALGILAVTNRQKDKKQN